MISFVMESGEAKKSTFCQDEKPKSWGSDLFDPVNPAKY